MRSNKIKHKKADEGTKALNESLDGGFYDQDPAYTNKVFKVKYTRFNTLSNKKGSDSIPKPVNDPLDGYEVGDIISGENLDGERIEGAIVNILKDAHGDGMGVNIEFNGVVTPLRTSTISMVSNRGGELADTEQPIPLDGVFDDSEVVPYTENLRHIKNYSQFLHEGLSDRR